MAIADVLDKLMYLTGSSVLRMKEAKALATGVYETQPAASEEMRGAMTRTEGATGVADQIAFCRKTSGDTYEWLEVNDTTQVTVGTLLTATNLGAGPTQRATDLAVDLTDYSEVKLRAYVKVAGNTGVVRLRYTFDAITYANLTSTVALSSTGAIETAWEAIPSEARRVVMVADAFTGGDAAEDPSLTGLIMMVRR